jgi:O-antigen/teichoic acid export membrane protein
VIRGSVWRIVGNAAGVIVGLITATLLLHHLGVAESGRYVTVMSLVAIAGSVAEGGLNITGSRELALSAAAEERHLLACLLGLRMAVTPFAVLAVVAFAVLVGYPSRMVIGTVLAGMGLLLATSADTLLLPLTVELRAGSLALVDFLRQVVTLTGVGMLVILGSRLTPFFAVQIVVGVMMVSSVPLLTHTSGLVRPRFDRDELAALLRRTLPLAAAIVIGQVYFRLVIVIMSIASDARQTGYFGGSLRAMEALANVPILVAAVALPMLAAAARDNRARLRYVIGGLSEGAVIAGVTLVLVTVRAAEPIMTLIGGHRFTPSGAVLRIQMGSLMFIALYQIWTVSLVALGRQRVLISANLCGLLGLAVGAALLVPAFGAQGGAVASVLGDALLASVLYLRLRASVGRVGVRGVIIARTAAAAAIASPLLLITGLPDLAAAALTILVFGGVGHAIGMVPPEVRDAFRGGRHFAWLRF